MQPLLPELPESEIINTSGNDFIVYSLAGQDIAVQNFGADTLKFRINGVETELLPGEYKSIRVEKNVPADEAVSRFYDPEFLIEPKLENVRTRMPY